MKYLILLFIGAGLVMIIINETAPKPTTVFQVERCTRYCHNHPCRHVSEIAPTIQKLYKANIIWLKNNPLGVSYKFMNLIVYVLTYPLLIIGLSWLAFRKRSN